MGHAPSSLDEPLKPYTRVAPPPWERYTGKTYTGREDWYTECGHTDYRVKMGKFVGQKPRFKEEDRYWWDPPVAKGTSILSADGVDSMFYGSNGYKGDTPQNFYEFRDNLMKNSKQYKQIAEKFEISKEHPGMDVSPVMNTLQPVKHDLIGRLPFAGKFRYLGPRFWDSPINEDCITKGLALAKYTAVGVAAYTLNEIKTGVPIPLTAKTFHLTNIFKLYVRNCPAPCALGFTYGVALCTSANLRRKDDLWNFTNAAAAFGFALASMTDNITKGTVAFITLTILSTVYQYTRIDNGLGRAKEASVSGFHSGPLAYKLFSFGDAPVPEKRNW